MTEPEEEGFDYGYVSKSQEYTALKTIDVATRTRDSVFNVYLDSLGAGRVDYSQSGLTCYPEGGGSLYEKVDFGHSVQYCGFSFIDSKKEFLTNLDSTWMRSEDRAVPNLDQAFLYGAYTEGEYMNILNTLGTSLYIVSLNSEHDTSLTWTYDFDLQEEDRENTQFVEFFYQNGELLFSRTYKMQYQKVESEEEYNKVWSPEGNDNEVPTPTSTGIMGCHGFRTEFVAAHIFTVEEEGARVEFHSLEFIESSDSCPTKEPEPERTTGPHG